METLVETKPVVVLVDDERSVLEDVSDAFGSSDSFQLEYCPNPHAFKTFSRTDDIAVLILDIRLGEGTYINELLELAKVKCPNAAKVVLSNYPQEISSADADRAKVLSKLQFGREPLSLLAAIDAQLKQSISPQTLRPFVRHISSRLEELEEELFSVVGYVSEFNEPYVDVVIREQTNKPVPGSNIFSFFARFVHSNEEPAPKHIRMRFEMFRAAGVGTDMGFKYRIFRKHNRTIAEVIPYDHPAQEPTSPEQVKELDELIAFEDKQWKPPQTLT